MLSISLQRECKWIPRNDYMASSDFLVPKYRFSVLRNKGNIHREQVERCTKLNFKPLRKFLNSIRNR